MERDHGHLLVQLNIDDTQALADYLAAEPQSAPIKSRWRCPRLCFLEKVAAFARSDLCPSQL
jgi:hypothetical protein